MKIVIARVQLLVLIFGAIYGMWQWTDTKEQRRVGNSLEMVHGLQTGEFVNSANNLINFTSIVMDEHRRAIREANVQEVGHPYAKWWVRLKGDNEFYLKFLQVMSLLDGIAICVEENMCDDRIAARLFPLPAKQLLIKHDGHIRYLNSTLSDHVPGAAIINFLSKSDTAFQPM